MLFFLGKQWPFKYLLSLFGIIFLLNQSVIGAFLLSQPCLKFQLGLSLMGITTHGQMSKEMSGTLMVLVKLNITMKKRIFISNCTLATGKHITMGTSLMLMAT